MARSFTEAFTKDWGACRQALSEEKIETLDGAPPVVAFFVMRLLMGAVKRAKGGGDATTVLRETIPRACDALTPAERQLLLEEATKFRPDLVESNRRQVPEGLTSPQQVEVQLRLISFDLLLEMMRAPGEELQSRLERAARPDLLAQLQTGSSEAQEALYRALMDECQVMDAQMPNMPEELLRLPLHQRVQVLVLLTLACGMHAATKMPMTSALSRVFQRVIAMMPVEILQETADVFRVRIPEVLRQTEGTRLAIVAAYADTKSADTAFTIIGGWTALTKMLVDHPANGRFTVENSGRLDLSVTDTAAGQFGISATIALLLGALGAPEEKKAPGEPAEKEPRVVMAPEAYA